MTVIDLSLPICNAQRTFPGDPPVRIAPHGTLADSGYNITALSFSTHCGTHLDAPRHFFDEGATVDEISPERFFGPAVLVDLGVLSASTEITVDMLSAQAVKFYPGAMVLIRTGWDAAWGTDRYFRDFPSLTPGAARWIARRRIGLLGLDTPSPGQAWKETHEALLDPERAIVLVECLANLDQLPAEFDFAAFPLAIAGVDGSPVRAVGIVNS